MKRPIILILIAALAVLGVSSLFIVTETEYAIKFQLGRIVRTDYMPGIHVKLPFVNNVRKFDRRLLTLDTNPEQMLTSEQKFVAVDSFVKWRIVDVAKFYTSTQGNEAVALNRLDSIVKDRIRNQIASRTLVELISEQRVSTMQDITRTANVAAAEPPPSTCLASSRPAHSSAGRSPSYASAHGNRAPLDDTASPA